MYSVLKCSYSIVLACYVCPTLDKTDKTGIGDSEFTISVLGRTRKFLGSPNAQEVRWSVFTSCYGCIEMLRCGVGSVRGVKEWACVACVAVGRERIKTPQETIFYSTIMVNVVTIADKN